MAYERKYKWLDVIRSLEPGTADAISNHISQVLERESCLPRKVKELILLGCATAMRSGGSTRSHALGAVRHGAKPGELLEVIALAALPSGYAAFIEAIEATADLMEPPGQDQMTTA